MIRAKIIKDYVNLEPKRKVPNTAAVGKPSSPDRSSFLKRYLKVGEPNKSRGDVSSDSDDNTSDVEVSRPRPMDDDDSSQSDDWSDDDSDKDDQTKKLKKLADFFLSSGKKDKKKKHHLKNTRYKSMVPNAEVDATSKSLMKGAPEFLDMIFRNIYSRKEVRTELETIKRPKNAEALKPVRVNPEIYLRMTEKERKKDEPMKYIQNAVAKAAMPLSEAWNVLLLLEDNIRSGATPKMTDEEDVVVQLSDEYSLNITNTVRKLDSSLKILGIATSQIVQKRRLDLKYKLAYDCKGLAKRSRPFTDFLFGDDMKIQAAENRKERNLSFKITRGKKDKKSAFLEQDQGRGWFDKQYRYQPQNQYDQSRGQNRGRGRSRGRGRRGHFSNQYQQSQNKGYSQQQPSQGK